MRSLVVTTMIAGIILACQQEAAPRRPAESAKSGAQPQPETDKAHEAASIAAYWEKSRSYPEPSPEEGKLKETNPTGEPGISEDQRKDEEETRKAPEATGKLPEPDEGFRTCIDGNQLLTGSTEEFRDSDHADYARSEAHHMARDITLAEGKDARLEARFSYGQFRRDLDREKIEILADICEEELKSLGFATTDTDGIINISPDMEAFPSPGLYKIHYRVAGNNHVTESLLRILKPDEKVAVFDIDGTLTTGDTELFKGLIPDYSPEERKDAAKTTRMMASLGYHIVYLTGRPFDLTPVTRSWLEEQGMAPGTLRVTDSYQEVLPTEDSVGDYKNDYLLELQNSGLLIPIAFGNAVTDIYAYQEAEIEQIYILGDNGGQGGSIALGKDFTNFEYPDSPLASN